MAGNDGAATKAEDRTIIPPTKEEIAALIAESVGKTEVLDDDEGVRKLQEVVGQMLNRFYAKS